MRTMQAGRDRSDNSRIVTLKAFFLIGCTFRRLMEMGPFARVPNILAR
jgi:hypothetical protein